jgi:hypothetical protein
MKHLPWLLIVAAPLLLMGGYWFVIDNRSGLLDWIVLAVAIGVGLAGIWSTPWRRGVQVATMLAYVPVMALGLAAGILFLECSTGNCL